MVILTKRAFFRKVSMSGQPVYPMAAFNPPTIWKRTSDTGPL